MKILAIEKEIPGTDWEKQKGVLVEEARAVYDLYLEGSIREIYFTEKKIAILVLECENLTKAGELLGTLPLVKNGSIAFDIMELRPYTGLNRILKA